jgi:hypothetical protein
MSADSPFAGEARLLGRSRLLVLPRVVLHGQRARSSAPQNQNRNPMRFAPSDPHPHPEVRPRPHRLPLPSPRSGLPIKGCPRPSPSLPDGALLIRGYGNWEPPARGDRALAGSPRSL